MRKEFREGYVYALEEFKRMIVDRIDERIDLLTEKNTTEESK